MKRLEVVPSVDNIEESIEKDLAGRNEDIVQFVKMLDQIEGPFTVLIDAPWGDGKTFFSRSVEYVLKVLNCHIGINPVSGMKLKKVTDKLQGIETPFLPFYFNAWENDFADDPISALFASMAMEFDRMEETKSVPFSNGVAAIIDVALAATSIGPCATSALQALKGKDYIEAYKNRADLRMRINSLADNSITEVANKLVIFIDELDRCRPDFAVRLLEQTKSLFQNENIIVVLVSDSVQLSKAVSGMYGANYDGGHFIERFFDYRLLLTQVDSYKLAYGEPYPETSMYFDKMVNEILEENPLTVRDAMRLNKIQLAREFAGHACDGSPLASLARCVVVPLLIEIERDDPELFRAITRGADFDALYECGKRYDTAIRMLDRVVSQKGNKYGVNEGSVADDQRRQCMHDLCVYIYSKNRYRKEYQESLERLDSLDYILPDFDRRIYATLSFPSA